MTKQIWNLPFWHLNIDLGTKKCDITRLHTTHTRILAHVNVKLNLSNVLFYPYMSRKETKSQGDTAQNCCSSHWRQAGLDDRSCLFWSHQLQICYLPSLIKQHPSAGLFQRDQSIKPAEVTFGAKHIPIGPNRFLILSTTALLYNVHGPSSTAPSSVKQNSFHGFLWNTGPTQGWDQI